MRLEIARGPDPLHRRRTDALGLGHRAAAPVRLTFRLLMQRRVHDLSDLLLGNRRFAPPPRTYTAECLQALLEEALAPRLDSRRGDHQRRRDLRVRDPIGR